MMRGRIQKWRKTEGLRATIQRNRGAIEELVENKVMQGQKKKKLNWKLKLKLKAKENEKIAD